LDLIQTHVESVYVWVPSRATERRRLRDAEIFQRRAAGESIHEVALALGLTARRICQIQQRARRMDRAGEGGAAATREQDALRDERDALRAELERLKAEAAVGIVEGA
jgi:cell division protein FtsB